MKDKDLKTKFTEWLETLQQESWQLEMIISGLSIALVVGVYDNVEELNRTSQIWYTASQSANALRNLTVIIHIGWFFLFINLCLHLLLRGLWISTLGLRYVSGDIDYDSLRYSDRFRTYLEDKIGSFDDYIERLEKLCSIIFAFTFLILFSLLSFAFFASFCVLFAQVIDKAFSFFLSPATINTIIQGMLITMLALGGLYMIDFVTLGFFKRRKKYFGWYFWVYRFMSLITFSWVYRPIYHNFTDNKFSRYFAFLMIPYIIVTLFAISASVVTHRYYPEEGQDKFSYDEYNYMDESPENTTFRIPKIGSKFIKNDFLEIYLPYNPNKDEKVLKKICPDYEPIKETGISNDFEFNISGPDEDAYTEEDYENDAQKSLHCLEKMWRIYLADTLVEDVRFFLYDNEKASGLKVVLDIKGTKRGQHDLYLSKQRGRYDFEAEIIDSLYWEKMEYIPFWVE